VADKVVTADSAWISLVIGGGAKGGADEQQVMAMAFNSTTALDRLSDGIIDFLDLLITVHFHYERALEGGRDKVKRNAKPFVLHKNLKFESVVASTFEPIESSLSNIRSPQPLRTDRHYFSTW
jgi:hypothetical protein